MKGKTAFDALGSIDPRYILEAAPDAPVATVSKRAKILRLSAVAAALALVVAAGAVMVPMLIEEPEIPTEDITPNISAENIFSVAQTHYGATSLIPDADVSLKNVVSQDENRPDKNSFVFKGTEYDLAYRESVFYPEADCSVHLFEVKNALSTQPQDPDIRPRVNYYTDGSLAGIYSMELGVIDMSNGDADDYVISAAEAIVEQYADLSRYECVSRIRTTPDTKSGFIYWYNKIGDKSLPGATSISITEDGVVQAITIGLDYGFSLTEEQLPTNEQIIEIVKKKVADENLLDPDTARDWTVNYTIIVFRGEVYAHAIVGFLYTELSENDVEQDRLGGVEYLIPITGASVSYGESETRE